MNPVELLSSILLGIIVFYILVEIIRALTGKKHVYEKFQVVNVGGHYKSYCGLSDRHVHYRIVTDIKHVEDGKTSIHRIIYYYCPKTRRIKIVEPKPLTPDMVKYNELYEEKSNSYGE